MATGFPTVRIGRRIIRIAIDEASQKLRAAAIDLHYSGEEAMKKLAMLVIATIALLSGCVAYEVPYGDGGARQSREHDRDGERDRGDRNRDGDGVSDRGDHRPDDARRY